MTGVTPSKSIVPARLRVRLAKPNVSYWLADTAVVLLAPCLWTGLAVDDYLHRAAVASTLDLRLRALDLFSFLPRGGLARRFAEELGVGWWIGPTTQVSYFRPLASLTHFVDYTLWPRAPWLMHLENLVWYSAVVVAVAALYARWIEVRWVAGLAAALYAFDHAHASPTGWIANRNALMATLFGVLSLLAHDRWRREGRHVHAWVAQALFALALLSAESGIAMLGYITAYALSIDRSRVRSRVFSLLPYAAVTTVWRLGSRALGFGVIGSGIQVDPLTNPGAFLQRAIQTVPIQIASDVIGVPADGLVALRPWASPVAALLAGGLLLGFGYVLLPMLRRDRVARFFAAGTVLSAIPLGVTIPIDRYLFWVGIGLMGLLAQLAGVVADAAPRTFHDRVARAVCAAALVLRGVASPISMPLRVIGLSVVQSTYAQAVSTLPAGPETAKQTVVLVNAPSDFIAVMLPVLRYVGGGPLPQHLYLLYSGLADVDVRRLDASSVELRAPRGWLPGVADRTLRSAAFDVGETVDLARMRAEVLSLMPDGRAAAVRFAFPVALDDPSLVFLAWGAHGLARFVMPAVGSEATVAAPPLVSRVGH